MGKMLKPGWLKEVLDEVKKDVETWPKWMRQDQEKKLKQREKRILKLSMENYGH